MYNGCFQKISIPIPRAASKNSEEEGGSLDWNSKGMGGFSGLDFQKGDAGSQIEPEL